MDSLSQWTPEEGAPQGAVLSPLLSNIYLDPLDHLMVEHQFEMVRYADDFVILCRTAEEAARALDVVRQAERRQRGAQHDPDPAEIARIAEEIRDAWGPRVQRPRVGRPRVKLRD